MGHGEPLSIELAVAWRDHGNSTCPDFLHWIEPA